jgi:hypothetical protein
MPILIQPSFAAGMLSPRLRGRVDLQQYPAGAEDLTNASVQTQGGASKRPGSYYIAAPGSTARVRLVPFIVSSAVAYVLEFGNLYLRIHRNRALLTDGTDPLEITTPYLLAQLRSLKFAQSADVLTIFHPSHQPRQLRRTAAATFELALLVFVNGPYDAENTGDVGAAPPSATVSDPEAGTSGGSAGGTGTGDGPDPSGSGGTSGGEGGGGGAGEAESGGGESGAAEAEATGAATEGTF